MNIKSICCLSYFFIYSFVRADGTCDPASFAWIKGQKIEANCNGVISSVGCSDNARCTGQFDESMKVRNITTNENGVASAQKKSLSTGEALLCSTESKSKKLSCNVTRFCKKPPNFLNTARQRAIPLPIIFPDAALSLQRPPCRPTCPPPTPGGQTGPAPGRGARRPGPRPIRPPIRAAPRAAWGTQRVWDPLGETRVLHFASGFERRGKRQDPLFPVTPLFPGDATLAPLQRPVRLNFLFSILRRNSRVTAVESGGSKGKRGQTTFCC